MSYIKVDCTGMVVEVTREDFELHSGVGEGGIRPIEGGKSFIIAQILQEVSKLLMDETKEDLQIGLIEARRGV